MKKAIASTIGLMMALGSTGHASVVCTTKPDLGKPTVQMEIVDDSHYNFSVFGHSRNTYKADYVITEQTGNHIKGTLVLTKVADHSTWNDMPNSLLLAKVISKTPFDNYWLSGLNGLTANFGSHNCTFTAQ